MLQEQINDTLEIQKLVGQVSKFECNGAAQKRFFTPDAQVSVYVGEDLVINFTGTKNFEDAFKQITGNVKRAHCLNGQHIIDFLTPDTATGLLFCRAVYVTEEGGKEYVTDHCVYCEDIYERAGGGWLIKARDTHYIVSDKHPLGY